MILILLRRLDQKALPIPHNILGRCEPCTDEEQHLNSEPNNSRTNLKNKRKKKLLIYQRKLQLLMKKKGTKDHRTKPCFRSLLFIRTPNGSLSSMYGSCSLWHTPASATSTSPRTMLRRANRTTSSSGSSRRFSISTFCSAGSRGSAIRSTTNASGPTTRLQRTT